MCDTSLSGMALNSIWNPATPVLCDAVPHSGGDMDFGCAAGHAQRWDRTQVKARLSAAVSG